MKPIYLHLQGDVQDCMEGVRLLASDFGYEISTDGLAVTVERKPGSPIMVGKAGDEAYIKYAQKTHFFRALGLLLEALREGTDSFSITEEPQFTMSGLMIDVSQGNALPRVATVKHILQRMAIMGLNMLMLYMEDSYEVEGEPYFGYMRSRYTYDELKACDDFAALFGIEMIPCMQTLAHLTNVLKWPAYADMQDDVTTLLVGSEKVYEFIERMIVAASAPFRSKRIHIGMDEAMALGRGAYLQQHGLRSKFDIMNEHLARVLEVTQKHGLQPMIWSDMYFRAAAKSGGYYDADADIPPHVIAAMPRGVQLVYWDYYHHDEAFYREYIRRHRQFGSEPLFAGGIWNWKSFTINWGKTFVTTNAALNACRQEGIKEVFATVWGDLATECHLYAILPGLQLFAEHSYTSTLDEGRLRRRFEFCTGGCYQDFIDIKDLDEVPLGHGTAAKGANSSKFLMWQDILTGLFDKHIEGLDLVEHYGRLTETLRAGVHRNGEYGVLFEYLSRVSHVLELKADMGLRITEAYRKGHRETLRHLKDVELPELGKRVEDLHAYHRHAWMVAYKALGWDILDMRYGALLARIQSAITEIGWYLDGRLTHIEELEEERLTFTGYPGMGISCNIYERIVSGSLIGDL